jgi:hypothetical protein
MNAKTYGQLVHGEIEYTENQEALEVKEVVITRAEGPSDLCGIKHTFASLSEAESLIRMWAYQMPVEQGGYDKVDFKVGFNDGDCYGGRIDMMPKHRYGYSIKSHMVDTIKYYANNGDADCVAMLPKYMSL